MSQLFIVESPAKINTIKRFLPSDFVVKASVGHIRDLNKTSLSVDVDNGFKPKYYLMPDKMKVVNDLRAAAKKADVVWLATDMDLEGEAISWHLKEVLDLPNRLKTLYVHNGINIFELDRLVLWIQ